MTKIEAYGPLVYWRDSAGKLITHAFCPTLTDAKAEIERLGQAHGYDATAVYKIGAWYASPEIPQAFTAPQVEEPEPVPAVDLPPMTRDIERDCRRLLEEFIYPASQGQTIGDFVPSHNRNVRLLKRRVIELANILSTGRNVADRKSH